MQSSEPIVEVKNISKYFGKNKVLEDVSFSVYKNEILLIIGLSGTGKSTLLKLICGLEEPDSGQVVLKTTHIGMVFQGAALFDSLNVFDNVAFSLREHTVLAESVIHDIVKMKLEAVGLRGSEKLMPAELSGGMARRIALARAMSLDPEMMLYDEPFTGQDPISMGVLLKLIRTLNDSCGLSSVLVSHDVREVLEIADEIFLISGGEVIGHGTPAQLCKDRSPLVKQFITGEPDGPVAFRYPGAHSIETVLLRGHHAE